MARLAITTLGSLRITLGDTFVDGFYSDKARALLIYLAVEADRPHTRENLAGLFWPEYPQEQALHSLRQALSSVRQLIGDRLPAGGSQTRNQATSFLDVSRQTVSFNLASDYWLDVERFIALARINHNQAADLSQTLSQLDDAMALYRGEFLAEFSLAGCITATEWLMTQREYLHRLAQEALTLLISGYTYQGRHDKALEYAWRQLELDPWREDAHRQVMRLLALTGQRTAALAHYSSCCTVLRKEFDMAPEPETTALFIAIQNHTFPSTNLRDLRPRQASPPNNLPAQLMPFVGRDEELATLKDMLANSAYRLFTLVGLGGAGKTRLAIEAAAASLPRFTDGAYLVSLESLRTSSSVIGVIAQTIGMPFADLSTSEEKQLHKFLEDKNMLLILDSAERMLAENGASDSKPATPPKLTDAIIRLLEAAPGLKVIVTSRVGLQVLGEYLFPVGELAYPENVTTPFEKLIDYAAVQLFIQGARQRRPDFTLTFRNAQPVCEICHHVEGLPLAILLVASWTNTMSVADIALQLNHRNEKGGLDLLETDWPNVPTRQRSMNEVFKYSWYLLSEHQQAILKTLSVFRDSFTQDAASYVSGATLKDLQALVNASLLDPYPEGRFTLHRLVQQYAEAHLASDPSLHLTAHDRHCAYFTDKLQGWAEDAKGARQQEALAEMDIEVNDARAAWDWAVAHDDLARMDRAIDGLGHYYQRRWFKREGEFIWRAAFERLEALEAVTPAEASERLRILVKLLTWQSWFLPLEQVIAPASHSLALLESVDLSSQDLRQERAAALLLMGRITVRSNPETARPYFEESLALARACGDTWTEGRILLILGHRAIQACDLREAEPLLQDGLTIARSWNDIRGISQALQGLATIAWCRGYQDYAMRLARENLAIWRNTDDALETATGLWLLAIITMLGLGRAAEAFPLIEEYQTLVRNLPDYYGTVIYGLLTQTFMFQGNYEQAQIQMQNGFERLRRFRDEPGTWQKHHVLAIFYQIQGCISLGMGAYAEAESLLQASIVALEPHQLTRELFLALACLGIARWSLGKEVEAVEPLAKVLREGLRQGYHYVVQFGLLGAALIRISRGETERAVELMAGLMRWSPLFANNRWVWDVAGRHAGKVAKALAPAIVAAAQARGRAREMMETAREVLEELGG